MPPQSRRVYQKKEYLSFWPRYIGEKGRTLGKTYGIKVRCYWEHPREHIGKLGVVSIIVGAKLMQTKLNDF
jgi:hypothetical protein